MNFPTLEPLLAMLRLRQVGRRTAFKALGESTTSVATQEDFTEFVLASRILSTTIRRTRHEAEEAWRSASKTLEYCMAHSISVRHFWDPSFPSILRRIPDPPLVLFWKGAFETLYQGRNATVIGTREPSDFARKWAGVAAQALGKKGFSIVSGLALGCDTAAHEGALAVKAPTAAVLAHGLDTVYPKQNANLADRILGEGGCLISEYPPKSKIERKNFVERDRLQSGLSILTLVVETSEEGGSMHTARFCREQGRLLAALKHPLNVAENVQSSGNRQLILNHSAAAVKTPIEVANLATQEFKAWGVSDLHFSSHLFEELEEDRT